MNQVNPRRFMNPRAADFMRTSCGPDDPLYPPALPLFWNGRRLPSLSLLGNGNLLRRAPIGILCSRHCPGETILHTYEIVRAMPPERFVVAGGFHSPMERQCLETLLARKVPVILCIARALPLARIRGPWTRALREDRLCIVSACLRTERRVTRALADRRNLLVAAIADVIFVPFASAGGSIERLLGLIRGAGKRVVGTDEAQGVFSVKPSGRIDLIEWFDGGGDE